jgi:hypothetical protein
MKNYIVGQRHNSGKKNQTARQTAYPADCKHGRQKKQQAN